MHRSRRPAVPDLQLQFSLYVASAGICYDVPSEGLYLVNMLADDYCVVPDNRAVVVNTDSIQIGAFGERRYTLAVGLIPNALLGGCVGFIAHTLRSSARNRPPNQREVRDDRVLSTISEGTRLPVSYCNSVTTPSLRGHTPRRRLYSAPPLRYSVCVSPQGCRAMTQFPLGL